jgi:hypothetical protein
LGLLLIDHLFLAEHLAHILALAELGHNVEVVGRQDDLLQGEQVRGLALLYFL